MTLSSCRTVDVVTDLLSLSARPRTAVYTAYLKYTGTVPLGVASELFLEVILCELNRKIFNYLGTSAQGALLQLLFGDRRSGSYLANFSSTSPVGVFLELFLGV